MGHHGRLDAEQAPEVLDALGERAQRLRVLQVPDVLGDDHLVPCGQAERVLQLGPDGQHRPPEPGVYPHWLRYVAP
jgi:hypothetical protein